MTKEFNLSDKIKERNSINWRGTRMVDFVYARDVKEFIKRLNILICDNFDVRNPSISEIEILDGIDKLAGDKLK